MTEEEFYKKIFFNGEGLNQIRQEFPDLVDKINRWYKSERYNNIQRDKNRLKSKLFQPEKGDSVINFNNEQLYSLFRWWDTTPKVCYYCGLPENCLEELNNQPGHINKRYSTRGRSLEIDRKDSERPYTDIENLVMACYWCNNAKTDTFSENEFLLIGRVIKQIWEQRLNKKI